jgi:hypothetical protein
MRPSCSAPCCRGAGCGGATGFTAVTDGLALLRGGALNLAFELLTRLVATFSGAGGTAALSGALAPVQPVVRQASTRRSKAPLRLSLWHQC